MKNYLIGSNNYAVLMSYLLSDIEVIHTSKFELNNISPEFLPENDKIEYLAATFGFEFETKSLNVFFDDRGKISTKPSEAFKNIYALTTRGKISVENSFFNNFYGSINYISLNGKNAFDSYNFLFENIKKSNHSNDNIDVDSIDINDSKIIKSDGEVISYDRLIWTGDIRNLKNINLFTKKIYVYICDYGNKADEKMSDFFTFGYSVGKPYFRTIYYKDKIEYHCMKKVFDDKIDNNKIINELESVQIIDNLRKNNLYNIDLIGPYAQWNLGYNIEHAFNDANELCEYYNASKKIGKNIFKSQQNLLY